MNWWNPTTWNWGQWEAAGRHGLTYLAGGLSVLVAWGLLAQGDSTVIMTALNEILDGSAKVVKGLGGLAAVLIPIYTALKAAKKSSPPEQVKSVAEIAMDPTSPVRGVIMEPTPEGKALAESIPLPTAVPANTIQAAKIANGGIK